MAHHNETRVLTTAATAPLQVKQSAPLLSPGRGAVHPFKVEAAAAEHFALAKRRTGRVP